MYAMSSNKFDRKQINVSSTSEWSPTKVTSGTQMHDTRPFWPFVVSFFLGGGHRVPYSHIQTEGRGQPILDAVYMVPSKPYFVMTSEKIKQTVVKHFW